MRPRLNSPSFDGDLPVIRTLAIVTALLGLTGCSAFVATVQDFYYHGEVFAPRRAPAEVQVFHDGRPRTPFIVLGRLEATQGMFGSRESVMAALRNKAAAMGADALIDFRESHGPQAGSGEGESSEDRTQFAQEGNISTSESWSPQSRSSIRMTISALAIRYQQP